MGSPLDRERLMEQTKAQLAQAWKMFRSTQEPALGERFWLGFLGTGGNPEAVVGQVPATGGFLLRFGPAFFALDPGPGALPRALAQGWPLGDLHGVLISHRHLDHVGGAAAVIEAMCRAMYVRRGHLIGHATLLEEQVIDAFHQGRDGATAYPGGPHMVAMKPGDQTEVAGVQITAVKAYHGGPNLGYRFHYKGRSLAYTSDSNLITSFWDGQRTVRLGDPVRLIERCKEITGMRDDLIEAFAGVEVIVANVTSHMAWWQRHLTDFGVVALLRAVHPKLCILTHFNRASVVPSDLRQQMAAFCAQESGVAVLAAYDGASFDLEDSFS